MDAHAREYAGAAAGMAQTYGHRLAVDDRVRVELPFQLRNAEGVIVATNGVYVMVEVEGDRLAYYPHECEYLGPGC
jgi:hypothetical protein